MSEQQNTATIEFLKEKPRKLFLVVTTLYILTIFATLSMCYFITYPVDIPGKLIKEENRKLPTYKFETHYLPPIAAGNWVKVHVDEIGNHQNIDFYISKISKSGEHSTVYFYGEKNRVENGKINVVGKRKAKIEIKQPLLLIILRRLI